MKWIIGLMLVLGACSRRDEGTTITGAKVDASATPRQAELDDAAKRWNQAMSQRDLSLLAKVYGMHVTFYGVPLRHDQVIQPATACASR
jgi:nucleosome binding factor SPN SPT16 subunit